MTHTNRLAGESSLYLRQHAHNPVDWYPWGPAALARANQLNRPIFLSIGYSACHWCHVMEHESFEDPATAELMNEHFVCIKVDREERPDLDDIYMKAVQLINQGQGGWPMSVWLAPDLRPFYAGTYFPPDDGYGRPSFRRVLTALATAWRDRREELLRSAGEITEHLRDIGALPAARGDVTDERILENAGRYLARSFDPIHGGFGAAPKFPHAIELRLLLRLWRRFGDEQALGMVSNTLDHMARGGIYDRLGGGFHRYSVDDHWLVPHFEKMLYDNALLSATYLEAFQATGKDLYRQIAEGTLDYVIREMTCLGGGFYSTQDADSEGEEGKYFVWSRRDFDQLLGNDADFAADVWGVTPEGNFEGHNILFRIRSDEQDAALLKMSLADFRGRLDAVRVRLLEARSQRIKPGRDEKILASWNGLMIAAFARAGALLNRPDYLTAAVQAGEFVLKHLRDESGRLFRTCSADGGGKLAGYLEDYAFLAQAFTHLFEATLDERWLREAAQLADVLLTQFIDREHGGFHSTAADHEQLLFRPKDLHDGSTPSGNAMAVTALLRLATMLGRNDFRTAGHAALIAFRGIMEAHPQAAAQMLLALEFDMGPAQEVALIGQADHPDFRKVLAAARKPFAPRRLMMPAGGRRADGPVTLYLCENAACQPPVSDPDACIRMLQ